MSTNVRPRPQPQPRHLAGLLTRGPGVISSPGARAAVTLLILAGAALTVISGAVHLYLWGEANGYRLIPTIGPLFLVQGISAVIIGLATAATRWLAGVLAAAGVLAGTAAGLVITVVHGMFGFRESWSAPWALASLYEEIAGAVLLLAVAAFLARAARAQSR